MPAKPTKQKVSPALEQLAAPFWAKVRESGLDGYFIERLLRALLRRWREDRFARVKQGGLHGDARPELARVFVDLDVGAAEGAALGRSERVVASWMRRFPHQRSAVQRALFEAGSLEVILGGPGQGKSTVGRFLSLIHGAILLLTAPVQGIALDAEVADLHAMLDGLAREGIPFPEVLQLPLWIELRELVDGLLDDPLCEQEPLRALTAWLAVNELRERDDAPFLEEALHALPWVIVFDGLDEVPPERGRAIVQRCVASVRRGFDPEDRRIIGTSRPQSYDREVFGERLIERTLQPLSPERAAVYAERLAASLYDEQDGERARLLQRMQKALANPTTAALMRNPLLVTIMAALVLHHGEPTDRRWTLFEEYYRALYRRETERGTFASATLREHSQVIDAIHMHVGMSLQARSERMDGVSALMPEEELRGILLARLQRRFSAEDAAQVAEEILRATEQRLVFLVQARKGMYGFELRSFQEFMAAWQVVSLAEEKTTALLRALGPLDAWRNVVLFAIGHQFAHNAALADERSIGLCKALDEADDVVARLVRPGARLALAVLDDAPYGRATVPREALLASVRTLAEVLTMRRSERLERVLGRPRPLSDEDTGAQSAALPQPDAIDEIEVELGLTESGIGLAWYLRSAQELTTIEDAAVRLETLADRIPLGARPSDFSDLPWPVALCGVASLDLPDGVATVLARLRAGELGGTSEWHRAERGPRGVWEVRTDDVVGLAKAPDPLRLMCRDGLMPPLLGGGMPRRWLDSKRPLADLVRLVAARQESTHRWVRRMIARLVMNVLDELEPTESDPVGGRTLAQALPDLLADTGTALDLGWSVSFAPVLGPDEFVDVIKRTTVPLLHSGYRSERALLPLYQALLRALASAPDSPRIQPAVLLVLWVCPSLWCAVQPTSAPLGGDIAARLLRLVFGYAAESDLPLLAQQLAQVGSGAVAANLSLLAACETSAPLVTPLVAAIVALPDASPEARGAAVDFLAERLARASSNLAEPTVWLDAGLPAPPPMLSHPAPPDAPGARIASIEITNLRAFDATFSVSASPPRGDGQWIVFLGENATGKTTLLRALALALAPPADAQAIPSNLDGPLRRSHGLDGVVRVRTHDGRELTATVSTADGGELVTSQPSDAQRPWVVGYGCRRGSATSGTDMDTAFVAFRDLDNLFDRPRGVVRASAWLKELQRRARNNGARSKDVFEAARAALRATLLGAEEVLVDNDVLVTFPDRRDPVPLNLLSDGYLTTAGWVADLMARWIKRCEDRRRPIGRDFHKEMEGVCLLDEIDLHLHPRWQERIIDDVRALFPKMTFVATTHHPLTLRGAREGEVFVLGDHEGTGRVTALQRDIPPGTRVDELVTGAWFNRPSAIVDQDTRDLLTKHQRLVAEGAKAGSPERKKVEAELRKRLGRYADTSLERLAATLVARHLGDDLDEPSAAQREAVRDEVLKILARRESRKKKQAR